MAQEFGYLGDVSEVHFEIFYIKRIAEMVDDLINLDERFEDKDKDVQESMLRFQSVFYQFLEKIEGCFHLTDSDIERENERDFLLEMDSWSESESESGSESGSEGEGDE